MKTYLTHDNGGRPFKVKRHGNDISVYQYTDYNEDENSYTYREKPVYTTRALKVFVGKSPLNAMTKLSAGHGPKFDGNSLLVWIKGDQYVYIGESIMSFRSSKIVKYVSPVGNNDVPYPYAIDIDGNYHLIIENVTVKIPDDVLINGTEQFDPYEYYYQKYVIANAGRIRDQPLPINPLGMGITAWFIGNEQYTMVYQVDPAKNYDKWIPSEAVEMYIVINGERKVLTKKEYVSIINRYGKRLGFKKMKGLKTIVKRKW